MRSFWSDPYLWIHLAGVAALPFFLGACLLGLAVGSPVLPVWLELFLVGAIGIVPVLWMQWFRPFYIFSILVVAVKPEKLTVVQQRILTRFKTELNRGLAIGVAILLFVVLRQLYQIAPLAAEVAFFPPQWRLGGLLLAALAFLGGNLFLQVPVSAIAVLLTSEAAFVAAEPELTPKIRQDFTILGWQIDRILPFVASDTAIFQTTPKEAIASKSVEKEESPAVSE
ncbi:MAG TPA: low-complexity tail membrane protein [Kamptonema sp.]|nr:low-complexity tail membrane protein [Kamptonema sp.]